MDLLNALNFKAFFNIVINYKGYAYILSLGELL